ncbi:MAG: HD domain-containing protein [Lachnospiraceae bacterium]|nr:HD domain-containing protein [Lachnospiraceae bacterium]
MIEFIRASHLKAGDILAKTIYNDRLQILLKAGNALTNASIKTIRDFGYKGCYIEHEGIRREDIPITEPLIDEAEELVFISRLKDMFSSAEPFQDPLNERFKKLRREIEDVVKKLAQGIRVLYNKGEFLYETEDYTRNVSNWIYHHSLNTCIISIGTALNMGLDQQTTEDIAIGAIYHDYGKAYFGEALYNKENVTDEDKALLRQHPEKMFRVLQRLNYPVNTTYAIYQHHEKSDGTGYPHGLKLEKITIAAQIVSLASAFDNLVNITAYNKEPMSQENALEYLQGCNLYSIDCMRALFNFIVPYPVGSKVKLSNGETGIVLKNVPGTIMRPYVLVGKEMYDLSYDLNRMNITILESVKDIA